MKHLRAALRRGNVVRTHLCRHGIESLLGFEIAIRGRNSIPLVSVHHARWYTLTALVKHREVELRSDIAKPRSAREPASGLRHILRTCPALRVANTKVVHRFHVALICSCLVPAHRLIGIGAHADAM